VAVLTNTSGPPPFDIAERIVRAALHEPRPAAVDLEAPQTELASISGHYDSDEGPVDLLSCGHRLCARLPGSERDMTAQRQGPHRYFVAPGVEVRFDARHGEPWAFIYEGGLFMDAKRRIAARR